jgi:hypothetical protein
MPKPCTYPIILDELISISTKDLKRLGLLEHTGFKSVELDIKERNKYKGIFESRGKMAVTVFIHPDGSYVELSYEVNGKPFLNRISLVQVSSNLGKGSIWYYWCCVEQIRCKKLYLVKQGFVSRQSMKEAFYQCQIEAKAMRDVSKLSRSLSRLYQKIKEVGRPYYITHYKRTLTKRHQRFLTFVQQLKF